MRRVYPKTPQIDHITYMKSYIVCMFAWKGANIKSQCFSMEFRSYVLNTNSRTVAVIKIDVTNVKHVKAGRLDTAYFRS